MSVRDSGGGGCARASLAGEGWRQEQRETAEGFHVPAWTQLGLAGTRRSPHSLEERLKKLFERQYFIIAS